MPKKLSHDADPENVPDIILNSQMELQPKRVFYGLVVGSVVLTIGILGAFYLSDYFNPEPIPIPAIEIKKATDSATLVPDISQKVDTTNWKVFTNPEYKYQLKYPVNSKPYNGIAWQFESLGDRTVPRVETAHDVVLTDFNTENQSIYFNPMSIPKDSQFLNIVAHHRKETTYGDKPIKEIVNESYDNPYMVKGRLLSIKMFGVESYVYTENNSEGIDGLKFETLTHISFEKDQTLYDITYKSTQELETILSTFKFLD